MQRSAYLCLTVVATMTATPVLAGKSAAKKGPKVTVSPQEVIAEGICRYTVSQGGEPTDEVRFKFRSSERPLARRGVVTPVVVFREYWPDLPPGAPESETQVYGRDMARFELVEERRPPGQTGPDWYGRPQAAEGLASGREAQVLGLPWLTVASPRQGLTWERTETLPFPRLKERVRYRVTGATSIGGRRAWKIERSLTTRPNDPLVINELLAPGKIVQWQETFWVDAGGRDLLRAERRIRLTTQDAQPVQFTLEADWVRKSVRPIALAEYQAQTGLFARLTQIERRVQEASARTTLDGLVDLRELKDQVAQLKEGFSHPRYESTFDRLDAAIDTGVARFRARPR